MILSSGLCLVPAFPIFPGGVMGGGVGVAAPCSVGAAEVFVGLMAAWCGGWMPSYTVVVVEGSF